MRQKEHLKWAYSHLTFIKYKLIKKMLRSSIKFINILVQLNVMDNIIQLII